MKKHTEVELAHEVEQRKRDLAADTGRLTGEVVRDAMAGHLSEARPVRELGLRPRELGLLDKEPK